MNKINFKKYVSYVKNKKGANIEDQYIEKDYFISLFLSTWQKSKNDGKINNLNNLIFKGGTLLARNFLNYPRLSEDIDFTYGKCNDLRKLSSKHKREKAILKLIKPIIKDIKLICDETDFNFEIDRTNPKYINLMNSRAVYLLNIYYNSMITGEEIPIKIEINFLENIINKHSESTINNIVTKNLELRSIGYDLLNIKINTYPLDEIILEKYRAILTREKLKERDIFDLYLIDKECKSVLKFDENMIYKKIKSASMISSDLYKNLENNCKFLINNDFNNSDDDIDRLSLIEIDKKDYEKFKKRLFDKLKEICYMK